MRELSSPPSLSLFPMGRQKHMKEGHSTKKEEKRSQRTMKVSINKTSGKRHMFTSSQSNGDEEGRDENHRVSKTHSWRRPNKEEKEDKDFHSTDFRVIISKLPFALHCSFRFYYDNNLTQVSVNLRLCK
jgi:hypothetical protein